MAKNFKSKASNAQAVYDDLNPQENNKEQEILEAQEALKTQGRKGMKALRMTMAFTPSNSEYIRTMAPNSALTMTQFVNAVVEEARKKDTRYQKIREIMDAE